MGEALWSGSGVVGRERRCVMEQRRDENFLGVLYFGYFYNTESK